MLAAAQPHSSRWRLTLRDSSPSLSSAVSIMPPSLCALSLSFLRLFPLCVLPCYSLWCPSFLSVISASLSLYPRRLMYPLVCLCPCPPLSTLSSVAASCCVPSPCLSHCFSLSAYSLLPAFLSCSRLSAACLPALLPPSSSALTLSSTQEGQRGSREAGT